MPTCPSGHRSNGGEWCDECGLRIAPSGPTGAFPPGATVPVAAGQELCPSCGTPREGAALFCEECRHQFSGPAAPFFPQTPPPYPPMTDHAQSAPSRVNRPAETLPPTAAPASETGDYLLSPPSAPGHSAYVERSAMPPAPQTPAPAPAAPTTAALGVWTAVVRADREYFTAMMSRSDGEGGSLYFPQYSPETRVPMTENQITIGRRRNSTGEAPMIDLARPPEDPGVSHRHAVLVRRADGGWAVIDQDSTNGTTVNGGSEAILPFHPIELNDGDRVHVGAWTTITLCLE